MKKFLVVLLALSLVAVAAFAADAKNDGTKLDPLVAGGDILGSVGIGYGGIAAGAEIDLLTIRLGPLPVTFGAGARAAIDPFFYGYGTTWAIGAFGMGHIGFKGLDLPPNFAWVDKTDTYIGLGLGFAGILSDYDYGWKPGIGISFLAGESYFLSDKVALYGEYGYIGKYTSDDWGWVEHPYYATVGVIFKLLGK